MFNANDTADAGSLTIGPSYELIDGVLIVPASRLDADQYSANDIDGVTESIFGSGNMAYASLQASQTDAVIFLNETVFSESNPAFTSGDGSLIYGGLALDNAAGSFEMQQPAAHVIPMDTDRSLDAGDMSGTNLGSEGNFTHTMVGALGVSSLSADAGSFIPSFSFGGGLDVPAEGGTTISNVINNVNVDDTIQNIVNTINETIENITNLGGDTIDNITDLGDQTINNVTSLANNVIENIVEGDIQGAVTNITDGIMNEITNVTETIGHEITEVTQVIMDAVNEITDSVLGEGGLLLHLDGGVLETLGATLDLSVDGGIAGGAGTDLVSGNLSAVSETLTGLFIPVVPDVGADIGFNLLGGADPNDGSDLSVAGVNLEDVNLDVAENLIGDIDVSLDIPADLADPQTLLDVVQDTVENIDNIDLAEAGDVLDIIGSQGVDGSLDILAGDTEIGEDFASDVGDVIGTFEAESGVNINDAMELLTDGNDLTEGLDISDAIGLLSDVIDDTMGGFTDGETSWTENAIDAGGLFDDLAASIESGEDILPDPSGTVAEGLGALNIDPDIGTGSLGGLLG